MQTVPSGKLLSPAEIEPLCDGALEALVDAAMTDPAFGRPFSRGSDLGGASARAARARHLTVADEALAAAMERRRQRAYRSHMHAICMHAHTCVHMRICIGCGGR